ncbi:5-oxoprolinase subunit PxpB [Aliiglaciecola litoralis]|uniref:5-oxoprolinase subunit PxpB n=1 Tax=Aliiglaciecola litoralis TaxID=582857 RepID=A0ABN1LCI7_9ALTE
MSFNIQIASENALIVYSQSYSLLQNNQAITALSEALLAQQINEILELIPAYQSLLVVFDLTQTDHYQMQQRIKLCGQIASQGNHKLTNDENKVIALPVCYELPQDNDLARIAMHNEISVNDVITLHCDVTYRVFSLGFAPGFAFMGETDPKIATPRLDSPRKVVPKGAVAIADRQTAIYPNESPGGWNILGLCPISLFDPNKQPACLFTVGDLVKFSPIDSQQYHSLLRENEGTM